MGRGADSLGGEGGAGAADGGCSVGAVGGEYGDGEVVAGADEGQGGDVGFEGGGKGWRSEGEDQGSGA